MSNPSPSRGEIWYVDLDPIRGHEQGGHRPALVVSIDKFNRGPANLVFVVPMTTQAKGIASHVPIDPPEGGLAQKSVAMCEAIRSIAKERLGRRLGAVTAPTMLAVEDWLRTLQGL
jgi:mRNA interferase MazF